jgi:hypothetical protein
MHSISHKALPLLAALSVALLTLACGADTPTQPARLGTRIVDVGGNGQMSIVDSTLPQAFAVQVKGPDNKGLADVPVEWRITSGAGEFLPGHESVLTTTTEASGISTVTVRPTQTGLFTVTASTLVSQGPAVSFTASVRQKPDVVIRILAGFDCGDPVTFVGPDSSTDVVVPVGALIEWTYPVTGFGGYTCTARLKTLTAPPGGTFFDQLLPINDVFQFRVDAVGNWTYSDALNGGVGIIIVHAR